ncbi:MAG: hypothetical protein LQ342_000535 [Letrouitia transgressa]|nr:MAG: hypothetical protein LQ342_000535 [Letrouitia transgressa]
MGGRAKKATKKFEKSRLKDTLGRRKESAKVKQKQQIKAKRKARNARDNARGFDEEVQELKAQPNGVKNLTEMGMDQFFERGVDLPEPKKATINSTKARKRKRDHGMDSDTVSDTASNEEPSNFLKNDSASDEEGGIGMHKKDLDALAEKDPDFYKFLQDNDAELLDFGDFADVDQLSEDGSPQKKQKTGKGLKDVGENNDDQSEITMAMVEKWKNGMKDQYSLRAMRQVVLAFKAAAYLNSEDAKEHKYSISSPEVYHQLVVVALHQIPNVLNRHLPVKKSSAGKVHVTTDSKKFRTLTPLLKSYSTSVIHLLENLSDAPTIKLTLSSLTEMLPFLLSFKKILKTLVKSAVSIWSDTTTDDSARITAFLQIRQLILIADASVRTAVLKTTYQGLIKGSRLTNVHTLPSINMMKNSASELWGHDANIGYTTGFVFIRQLAVHLRQSITHPTKDSYKQVYNWQYIHSLDFWSRVLSTHCSPLSNPSLKTPSDSSLHALVYPLVQISLGALRLIPTPAYYPLRFHLTRSLLRLSRATTTYIPLAPSLLEVLHSPELSKKPKPSTLKPLDFATVLRAPKSYLRTRVYQDGVGEQLVELLAEFFGIWAKHIAFPELVLPPSVQMKRWMKAQSASPNHNSENSASQSLQKNKSKNNHRNSKLASQLSLLLQKLTSNAQYVAQKRANVDFGPSNREGVEGFLREVKMEDMPLGAFIDGLRRKGEEREKMLEEARRADRERNRRERNEDRWEGMEVDGAEGEEDEE